MASDDQAEFEAYVARDSGRLHGFAALLGGTWHDAEDLVQQALLRSASRWPTARERPEAYTRKILINLARDRWRSRRHNAEHAADDLADLPAAPWSDDISPALERQLLLRACRLLPVQQRAVLVLRFWEDRSVAETAAVLGCTEGTVKSHTHRALHRLRLVLEEAPEPVPDPERKDQNANRG
ncbi:MAG TPA: SigE family RNA polymerase sigma factor [Streptosporangiaceae bacterium]|jgi:RNA polymerase sigma-70 factor (sigma-E family)|nr:SigE family RNA polymerase sigma factor [Streptosporangiaceae bacterium]